MHLSGDRLLDDLAKLGEIGAMEGSGRTRLVLTPADFEARRFLITRMKEARMQVRVDQVGNIIGRRGNSTKDDLPVLAFGSHIDTVPSAGTLDGCYGVLAGLEVIRTLNDERAGTRHPLELISFSNEEGVRFPMMIGSKVASGIMDLETAYELRDNAGITYRQALEAGGLLEGALVAARRTPGEIGAWLELHIEQGPILESERLKIGVVESIVGLVHMLVTIQGRAGHAGTTPMNARRDPMLAAAQIILEVNKIGRELSRSSVATVGLLNVQPGAMNVIPGKVEVGIDLRDISGERIDQGMQKVRSAIDAVCKKLGLEYTTRERARLAPQPMSRKVMGSIEHAARRLGATYRLMPSGAGHDTQNMARICETGMIFVPSKGGVSHAPDEWTDPADLALGANVLLETLLELDRT